MLCNITVGQQLVLCSEVVLFLECPLLNVLRRVSYRIFGLGGNSLYINKVRDWGHSSPRKKFEIWPFLYK